MCIIDIIRAQVAYFTLERPFPIPLLYYLHVCWNVIIETMPMLNYLKLAFEHSMFEQTFE